MGKTCPVTHSSLPLQLPTVLYLSVVVVFQHNCTQVPTAHTKHNRRTLHLHLTVAQLWKSRQPLLDGNTHRSLVDTVYFSVVVTFLTAQLYTDSHSSHKAQKSKISPPSYCDMTAKMRGPSSYNTHVSLACTVYLSVWSHFRQHHCSQMSTAHTKHSRATSHLHLIVPQSWSSWKPLLVSTTHGSLADMVYLRVVVTFPTAQLHTDTNSSHKAHQSNISPPSDYSTIMEIQGTLCSWQHQWVLSGHGVFECCGHISDSTTAHRYPQLTH